MTSNTRRAAARQRGEEQRETESQDRIINADTRSRPASEQTASQMSQKDPAYNS
jgi:hypothetical protein